MMFHTTLTILAANGRVVCETCPTQNDFDEKRQFDEHLDDNESQPYRMQNHVEIQAVHIVTNSIWYGVGMANGENRDYNECVSAILLCYERIESLPYYITHI